MAEGTVPGNGQAPLSARTESIPIGDDGNAPLKGIRVADFGHKIAGPLTAVLLADQGADVVHVDAPGAAEADHPADAFFSRGKRRITLDLNQPADRATARAGSPQ
jgi:crotonobetainyl-CoA:carnitine CoA-transferase CaiB-like acyl-CoA transferase